MLEVQKDVDEPGPPHILFALSSSKVTTPQDAGLPWLEHFSMLYIGEMFVSRLQENKVHCYIATRPEVESLGVQSFVVS